MIAPAGPTPGAHIEMRVAGAVLAGGASRRMGRDKATLPVDGVAMARRVADALVGGGCVDVVAIGGDPVALAVIGLDVVTDIWPGEGPLAGIVVALRHAGAGGVGPVLVAACDLPWLDAPTVRSVLVAADHHPDADVVHARSDRVEPLLALWRPSALARVEAAFAAGERSVMAVLDRLTTAACQVEPAVLANVNRPADLPKR